MVIKFQQWWWLRRSSIESLSAKPTERIHHLGTPKHEGPLCSDSRILNHHHLFFRAIRSDRHLSSACEVQVLRIIHVDLILSLLATKNGRINKWVELDKKTEHLALTKWIKQHLQWIAVEDDHQMTWSFDELQWQSQKGGGPLPWTLKTIMVHGHIWWFGLIQI